MLSPSGLSALEIAPAALEAGSLAPLGRYSERTLVVAIEMDRDGARINGYTVKSRPFLRAAQPPAARASLPGREVQAEVTLLGPDNRTFTQRVSLPGLCLEHAAGEPGHVAGDTIRIHRDSFLVELPELPGFDRVEVAYYKDQPGAAMRRPFPALPLAPEKFQSTEPGSRYDSLAFAAPLFGNAAPFTALTAPHAPQTAGAVHWPEEYGESVDYLVYGNAAESAQRVNIVIVPDGYTHAEKATMEAHAQAMVNAFKARTPYGEHTPLINYTLVYAYSTASGTDQCDCSIVVDTAMATRFPNAGYPCGDSNNRCLYYGNGNGGPDCDPNVSTANITAAELRAPAHDNTIIMVNTTRYGGCGGDRAVYSAGNSSATEVALHELGHSFAGLADEYAYSAGCGTSAGEVNTSLNGTNGAWPEWIATTGSPQVGADYYQSCIYRPMANCEMRALGVPFCPVCAQQFSLRFFGQSRVSPTAPIASQAPAPAVTAQLGQSVNFSTVTRLAQTISGGPAVTNSMIWQLQGPGFPSPTTVSSGSAAYSRSFSPAGSYTLTFELIADTNFIKPGKTAANRDVASWTVNAVAVPEVSDDAIHRLKAAKNGSNVDLKFEDTGSTRYNLYVSNLPASNPFKVTSAANGKKQCGLTGVASIGGGMNQVTGYNLNSGITGSTAALFYVISADNGPTTEGSLGTASGAVQITADSYCNR